MAYAWGESWAEAFGDSFGEDYHPYVGPPHDAWGGSWGASWSGSWGVDAGEATTEVAGPLTGGGIPHDYPRTRKDIARDRERFGIPDEAARTIAEVAARQVERLERDEHKRFEELSRELQLRNIEWDARYLEALNVQREDFIDAEIAVRLKAKIRSDDEMIVLMLLAASL